MRTRFRLWAVIAVLLFTLSSFAQEKVDLGMVTRIRYEGFYDSKVMQLAGELMDGIGPRLTGSPNLKRAQQWALDRLTGFGLVNAHLEPWSPFGRGWANDYTNVRMVAPSNAILIGYPKAWTPGTNGVVRGQCIRADIRSKDDFAKYRGKLAGKIVIFGREPELKPMVASPYERYDEKALADINQYEIPSEKQEFRYFRYLKIMQFQKELNQFFSQEKPLAIIDASRGLGGGTVFVQSGGSYRPGEAATVPALTLATEQWDRIARLLKDNKPVELELNVVNHFYDDQNTQYNVIAEIPGTDLKDQVVMLGAHFDSWHSGTCATDNGAGSVVMMEAVRILQALKVQPRRTIRIALWSGEEQGLLGSQHYVEQHFGSRPPITAPEWAGRPTLLRRDAGPVTLKPEQKTVSVYFNVDNGTGKLRGVYLQENAAVQPIFEAWMKPFADLGMNTLSMRNTGGTDHLSFDAAGIPGFQFIQDPVEYDTRTHHSNMDVYDRLQPDDLKQAAVIVADFVYNAAMRDQMFPRKPVAPPLSKEEMEKMKQEQEQEPEAHD